MKQKQYMGRRDFLKSMLVAGTAPYFVPSNIFGSSGQTAPSNKITLGVIGVGAMGKWDMKNFLGLDNVRVTAICDINKQNIEEARKLITERYGGSDVKVYSDFRELNADSSIDAVLMALPVHWHSIPSLDAILNGKHIYHEKPMAMSFAEAKLVRDAVRKKGVVFQFGTQQRSDLKFRWACELALNGRLGKLQEIQVAVPGGVRTHHMPERPVPDYLDWERWVGPAPMTTFNEDKIKREWHENMANFSLGMISCWGIHHIDIAQWGNGTDVTGPTTVEGTGIFPKEGSCDAIVNWNVKYEFANAAPVTFVDSGNGLRFKGDEATVFVKRGDIIAPDTLLRDPENKYGTMPVKLPISKNHGENFVEAIINGDRAICDIETAVRSDTLCQIGLISVKLGRKLQWDPKAEQFVNDDEANAMLQPRKMRGDWALPTV